jgi:putative ABC transport system ATP-binding protein
MINLIALKDVEKTYGEGDLATPVLKNVSFSVADGEFVAVMGASGAGKTTLMNILGCLDKPTTGNYLLEDVDVNNLDDLALSQLRNEKIGFVFQQFYLLERTTALKNVMLPLIYAENYPADVEERARKVLAAVGLADRIDYQPSQLSGGQQQRVAIARALINSPHLILADEPTGNLDSQSSLEILAILQRLHREGGTIIVITHDEEVAEHADRIVVLQDGEIVEERKVKQCRDAQAELSAQALKEDKQ